MSQDNHTIYCLLCLIKNVKNYSQILKIIITNTVSLICIQNVLGM